MQLMRPSGHINKERRPDGRASKLRRSAVVVAALLALVSVLGSRTLADEVFPGETPEGVAIPTELMEEVRPDEMADFAVRSLTVKPRYPKPGERAEVQVEIENRGPDPVKIVEVALFADGEQLALRRTPIAGRATVSLSAPWTPRTEGVHSLSASVDPYQRITEIERANNSASIDVPVAAQPPVGTDFSIVSVSRVSEPEKPSVIRAVIRNDGRARATAPLVIKIGDAEVSVLPPLIGPGEQATVDIPWSGSDRGPISAEINPAYSRFEPRSDNNAVKVDGRTGILDPGTAGGPSTFDLQVSGLSLGTTRAGSGRESRVTVTFRIDNVGRAITLPFRTRIATDPASGPPSFVTTKAVATNGTIFVTHTLNSTPNAFALSVAVDVDNVIAETDEQNNVASTTLRGPSDIDRWVSIGPRKVDVSGYGWREATGVLSTIAIDPSAPGVMYVGGQTSGVWKTTDGGHSWSPLGESATLRIAALAIAPGNPSRILLTTQHDGVFRSDDAGVSWTQISDEDLDAMRGDAGALLINLADPRDMLVVSKKGIYRSQNGGVTWTLSLPGGEATGLVRSPQNPSIIFAAIMSNDPNVAGIYRSFDGGTAWRQLSGCPGGALPANDDNTLIRLAASGGKVFASYRANAAPKTFKLFRSDGLGCSVGGVTDISFTSGWTASGTSNGDPIPQVLWGGLWADPKDPRTLFLGGSYLWKSTNSGDSFSPVSGMTTSGSAHMDHHGLAFDPHAGDVIYSVGDGGIYRSTRKGASGSWELIGEGISNVEFYDHVAAPTDQATIIGGTQDNGTLKGSVGNPVWRTIHGGDGATVDIDWSNADIMYAMGQYAKDIERSTNGGGSFAGAASGLPGNQACFNLHYQVHPSASKTLLASCNGLWRSLNSGGSWTSIFTPPAGAVTRSAIDGPGDVYFVGTSTGAIFLSQPGGAVIASPAFQHPASMSVTDIEIDLADRTVAYATFTGTNGQQVYRLKRSPSAPQLAAQDITSDLPKDLNIQTVAIDRNRAFTVYVGTDWGIYQGRSVDSGATWFWRPYMSGMPNSADVRDLEVHPRTGVMRAATFGRSAYEVNTDDPTGSVLVATGQVTFLRVHDVGTGYGPPLDQIDGEVIVKLSSQPQRAFGFQLRSDANEADHRAMLDLLRDTFRRNQSVRLEYIKTGSKNGLIIRVMKMH